MELGLASGHLCLGLCSLYQTMNPQTQVPVSTRTVSPHDLGLIPSLPREGTIACQPQARCELRKLSSAVLCKWKGGAHGLSTTHSLGLRAWMVANKGVQGSGELFAFPSKLLEIWGLEERF